MFVGNSIMFSCSEARSKSWDAGGSHVAVPSEVALGRPGQPETGFSARSGGFQPAAHVDYRVGPPVSLTSGAAASS